MAKKKKGRGSPAKPTTTTNNKPPLGNNIYSTLLDGPDGTESDVSLEEYFDLPDDFVIDTEDKSTPTAAPAPAPVTKKANATSTTTTENARVKESPAFPALPVKQQQQPQPKDQNDSIEIQGSLDFGAIYPPSIKSRQLAIVNKSKTSPIILTDIRYASVFPGLNLIIPSQLPITIRPSNSLYILADLDSKSQGIGTYATEVYLQFAEQHEPISIRASVLVTKRGLLDRYAKPFVAQWLKNVNEEFTGTTFISYQPWHTVEQTAPAYIRQYRPTSLQPTRSFSQRPQVRAMRFLPTPDSPMITLPEVTPETYTRHFGTLLSSELQERIDLIREYDMYATNLELHDPRQHLYKLTVPGLTEYCPPVFSGDVILVRQLDLNKFSWTGIVYQGIVWHVARSQHTIYLRIDSLLNHSNSNAYYNIRFVVNENPFHTMLRAATELGFQQHHQHMIQSTPSNLDPQIIRKWLFPDVADGVVQQVLNVDDGTGVNIPPPSTNLTFIDGELNLEQKKAVQCIVDNNYGNVPFIISGPPGTGKTKTITEAILQVLRNGCKGNHRVRVLAVAPSNSAADTIMRHLAKYMTPSFLFRLNPSHRPSTEVPDTVLPFSCMGTSGYFELPPFEAFVKFKVVVTTCTDSAILYDHGLMNSEIGKMMSAMKQQIQQWSNYVHKIPSSSVQDDGDFFWTHLFVDEAGQASEPEIAVPISLLAPALDIYDQPHPGTPIASNSRQGTPLPPMTPVPGTSSTPTPNNKALTNTVSGISNTATTNTATKQPWVPQVILCGDHCQLGPMIQSPYARHNGLGKSLLERLVNRPLYNDQLTSRTHQGNLLREESTSSVWIRKALKLIPSSSTVPPFVDLYRNYRSHKSMLMVPSCLFYEDTLEPIAALTESLVPVAEEIRRKLGIVLDNPTNGTNVSNQIPDGKNGLLAPPINNASSSLSSSSSSVSSTPKPWPIVFIGIEGLDESIDDGASWYNNEEIVVVVQLVVNLFQRRYNRDTRIQVKDFGIVTPFREQVRRIRMGLREQQLASVNVGTVEDYQGMEKRIIILSTVRSRERFLEDDKKRGLGLIGFPQRFNVALTRAQELLVVVGNPHLLVQQDENWGEYLRFVVRNGMYTSLEGQGYVPPPVVFSSVKKAEEEDGSNEKAVRKIKMSRLEKASVYEELVRGSLDKLWGGEDVSREELDKLTGIAQLALEDDVLADVEDEGAGVPLRKVLDPVVPPIVPVSAKIPVARIDDKKSVVNGTSNASAKKNANGISWAAVTQGKASPKKKKK